MLFEPAGVFSFSVYSTIRGFPGRAEALPIVIPDVGQPCKAGKLSGGVEIGDV